MYPRPTRGLRSAGVLTSAALLLSTVVCEAQPTSSRRLLLRIDTFTGGNGPLPVESLGETLIFSDGLVVRRTEDTGCNLYYSRSTGPPSALETLRAGLAADRVGFARGACALGSFVPNGFDVSIVDWLGRDGRRTRFAVASPGYDSSAPCSEAIRGLVRTISTFVGESGQDPGLTTETINPPTSELCDLGPPPDLSLSLLAEAGSGQPEL